MATEIQCIHPKCLATFKLDETKVSKSEEWIQCPVCGNITKNPFYEK